MGLNEPQKFTQLSKIFIMLTPKDDEKATCYKSYNKAKNNEKLNKFLVEVRSTSTKGVSIDGENIDFLILRTDI